MITSYKKAKEDVLKCYNDFLQVVGDYDDYLQSSRLAGVNGLEHSLSKLAEQAEKIKEDKFCLMIAGEAKSGKSTFINAYLGTEILPMDVKQCTSSVIEIRYGTDFILKAVFADGREQEYMGEKSIKDFLRANAALDDRNRDIPITQINNEIIVKYKGKKVLEEIILDFLKGVKKENIHGLPEEEYNRKIRDYIEKKQPQWRDIVVKIEIAYPYEDKDMRGVRIIDSPGVNAAGRVGEVTESYIESADAIMFLRPIAGTDPGANSFKQFLESKSVDRNKNTMFLILTRAASETDETIKKACDEFTLLFGTREIDTHHGIAKEQIIPVDSKAELYYNFFRKFTTEEIRAQIKELNAERKLEPFVKLAWGEAEHDRDEFLRELKRYSNFGVIDQSLNRFGRKAQFMLLSDFLGRLHKIYAKMAGDLREKIEYYGYKAEDPAKLAVKVRETKDALVDIMNKMNETVDEISKKYAGSGKEGIIVKKAEEVMGEYLDKIKKINGTKNSSIDKLEKLSFRQVDKFVAFEDELQKKVVAECNEVLIALSDKSAIEFVTLEPDFSEEVVEDIKDRMRKESKETYTYTTGKSFKKTHTKSRFSQDKYFKLVKTSIIEKIEVIEQQAIRDLRLFVGHTIRVYTEELSKNAAAKKAELSRIEQEKKTADEIASILAKLNTLLGIIEPKEAETRALKGGINGNV